MPLHPAAQVLLEQMAAAGRPPLAELTIVDEARQGYLATAALSGPPQPLARVEELTIAVGEGSIAARLYAPESSGPLPVLVYYHGGGWVIGDLETHDPFCRLLAREAGCALIAVDYRRAPEHRFPVAAEDSYAAYLWTRANAAALDLDGERVAIGGDSAGGNLAAVVALMARDRGVPLPQLQILFCPVTDLDFETPSYRENGEGYMLTRDTMLWFWEQYFGGPQQRHPYASPLAAESLAGLSPALVVTAEYDPLRDEGEAYARRMAAAGVTVTLTRYPGMIHNFQQLAAAFPPAADAIAQAAAELRAAFARGQR